MVILAQSSSVNSFLYSAISNFLPHTVQRKDTELQPKLILISPEHSLQSIFYSSIKKHSNITTEYTE